MYIILSHFLALAVYRFLFSNCIFSVSIEVERLSLPDETVDEVSRNTTTEDNDELLILSGNCEAPESNEQTNQ